MDNHYRIRAMIMLPVLCFLWTVPVRAQDYKKVIEVVQKMEANFKTLIANEEKARKAEFEQLAAQIEALSGSKVVPKASVQAHQQSEHQKAKVNSSELLKRLQAGNGRFVEGKPSSKDFVHQRLELAKGQQPYAIVLTCSDSRVPPEFIFDESLGQLFIARTAGNIVDSVVLGSIEYAAEHLNAGLLVVLGHEACGAVKATIAGGEVPPNIGSLVWRIQPGVNRIKAKHPEEKTLLSNCVEENVRQQMEQAVAQSTVLSEMVEKGELYIVGGVYDLATGTVRFLSTEKDVAAESHAVKSKENAHGY